MPLLGIYIPTFWNNYNTPVTMKVKLDVQVSSHGQLFYAKFHLHWYNMLTLQSENSQIDLGVI